MIPLMPRLLVLFLSVCLMGCGVQRKPDASSHIASVKWRLFPNLPQMQTSERVIVRLKANNRVLAESNVMLSEKEITQQVELPDGDCHIEAEVVGKSKATFASVSVPDMEFHFILTFPLDEEEEKLDTSKPPTIIYTWHLNDPGQVISNKTWATARSLRNSVPVEVDFLRMPLLPDEESPLDLPVRMTVDGTVAFEGTIPSGNWNGQTILLNLDPGNHNLVIEVPGAVMKHRLLDLRQARWMRIHFAPGQAQPNFKIFVSNEPIALF